MILEKKVDNKTEVEQNSAAAQGLNEPQLEAVATFDTPLLVLAGAGSGKTRVITYKIARIIEQKMALPWQILAVTFTNKAAAEMLSRIGQICGGQNGMNIGTFHSICARMLRSHAPLVGFNANFTIADSSDQKSIIKDIMAQNGLDAKVFAPQVILSFISRVKEKFVTPEELSRQFLEFPNVYREVKLDKMYAEYQARLKAQNMMDFDDLLFFTTKILVQNPEVLAQYREKFRYILIDEYQDINTLQYKWFRLLSGENPNVTCVGDDDQSIYGWRGADVSIILSFGKDFKHARVIKLEQNYRSTANILGCASAIIANNRNRMEKTLFTEGDDGEPVKITCYPDSKAEARDIVSKINSYKRTYGNKLDDFAILVRATSQTRLLEEAFIAAGTSYKIIGGLRFYERREVKDILSYIKVINGTADDLSFERVLKTPRRGIGDSTIDKLYDYARKEQVSLMEAAMRACGEAVVVQEDSTELFAVAKPMLELRFGPKIVGLLGIVATQIKKWRKECHDMKSFIALMARVIEELRYIEFLKEEEEEGLDARVANINELLNSMQGFKTVDEFLEHISLVSALDSEDENAQEAVKIMTMHTSKGLEFPIVFLPGWEEGLFPSGKTVEELGEAGVEEERRLAYVGITRAREELFISHARLRMIYGGMNSARESSFISEIKTLNGVEYRDKSIGASSGYSPYNKPKKEASEDGFSGGSLSSFSEEIKATRMLGMSAGDFEVGDTVSHKIFGKGVVTRAVSSILFEVKFEGAGAKTIRGDFLKHTN